jgi:hypothetical protein
VNVPAEQRLKGGVRIRLSGRPFQVLLLTHPGDVVTNEQLREQVWQEGTFVDFEHAQTESPVMSASDNLHHFFTRIFSSHVFCTPGDLEAILARLQHGYRAIYL